MNTTHEESKWNLPSLKHVDENDVITVANGSHLDRQMKRAIQAEKDLIEALEFIEQLHGFCKAEIEEFNLPPLNDFLNRFKLKQ